MGAVFETGFVISGNDDFPTDGVTDVQFWETVAGTFLIVGSQAAGAVTVWDISDPMAVTAVDAILYSPESGTRTLTDLVRVPADTGDMLLTLGRHDDNYGLYGVGTDGTVSLIRALKDTAGSFERGFVGTGFAHDSESYIYTAGFGRPGFDVFSLDAAGGATLIQTQEDSDTRRLGDVSALHTDHLQGRNMLFAASAADSGIHVFALGDDGLTEEQDLMLPTEAGFARVTDLDSVQIGPRAFLIAAGGQSDSLSVFRVSAGYQLNLVDHRLDTLDTRFEGVQDIEVFQIEERSFVVAAGADDGVTLFEIDYRGRLHHIDTITDGFDIAMRNVSSLSVRVVGETAHVYAGSESEHGVTELVIDLGRSGEVITGGPVPETLTGTDGDDVIWGAGRSDVLIGEAGDDRLIDGRGRDTLSGGPGADIFQFIEDGRSDFITDFEPGIDRIDLTDFDGIDHFDDIYVGARINGAVIIVRDDIIRLTNPDGGPYDIDLIGADSFIFG